MPELLVFGENIFDGWKIDEKIFFDTAKKIFNFYISDEKVYNLSCLKDYNYNVVSFDFLFCDSVKTHQINKDYRKKDYAADIITFAIFADTPDNERFIFDGLFLFFNFKFV